MDCNKTETFFAEWKRMCSEVDFLGTCLLAQKGIVIGCTHCEEHVRRNIDKAIEIVQEWSDSHPVKTRLSVFLEKYPKTKLYGASEIPRFCVADLYGTTCENMGMVGVGCTECWNTPTEQELW